MKTIIFNDSSVSAYIFDDTQSLVITTNDIKCPAFSISDMNVSNATIYKDVTPPVDWQGGMYLFDGMTWTLNPNWIDPKLAAAAREKNRVAESATVMAANVIAVAALLVTDKAAFIVQVKSEAGALTQQVLQGLGSEYELAEKEANAYKAAGYTGTVLGSVQDEIASKAAKGITITATVGCNTILLAATNWRTAQASLRRNRLTVVSAAEVAIDGAALDVIKTQWDEFMIALKLQLV